MRNKRILKITVVLAALWVMNLSSALAGTLFIGNTTQCAQSTCTALGTGSVAGEGIGIAANTLTIYDQGSASNDAQAPLLLLRAVPNAGSTYTPPSISVVSTTGLGAWTGTLGGSDVYGGTWNSTTGFAGTFNSASGGSVYNVAGFSKDGGGSSENWTNLSTLDSQLGVNASSFAVFVYTLNGSSNVSLAQTQYLTIDFSGDLTKGTFAMAYGCESGNLTSSACSPVGKIFATPFTHVGDASTVVPEPATGMLTGLGLLFGATALASLGLVTKPA